MENDLGKTPRTIVRDFLQVAKTQVGVGDGVALTKKVVEHKRRTNENAGNENNGASTPAPEVVRKEKESSKLKAMDAKVVNPSPGAGWFGDTPRTIIRGILAHPPQEYFWAHPQAHATPQMQTEPRRETQGRMPVRNASSIKAKVPGILDETPRGLIKGFLATAPSGVPKQTPRIVRSDGDISKSSSNLPINFSDDDEEEDHGDSGYHQASYSDDEEEEQQGIGRETKAAMAARRPGNISILESSTLGVTSIDRMKQKHLQGISARKRPLLENESRFPLQMETPSVLPDTTLLEASVLQKRKHELGKPPLARKSHKSAAPLLMENGRAIILAATRDKNRRRKKANMVGGDKDRAGATEEEAEMIKEEKKLSRLEEAPEFPRAMTKRIFESLLCSRDAGFSKCSASALDLIQKASQTFFQQVSSDLSAYAEHAGRRTIEKSDVELLFHRQRVVGTGPGQRRFNDLVRAYLPREFSDEILALPKPNIDLHFPSKP